LDKKVRAAFKIQE